MKEYGNLQAQEYVENDDLSTLSSQDLHFNVTADNNRTNNFMLKVYFFLKRSVDGYLLLYTKGNVRDTDLGPLVYS